MSMLSPLTHAALDGTAHGFFTRQFRPGGKFGYGDDDDHFRDCRAVSLFRIEGEA